MAVSAPASHDTPDPSDESLAARTAAGESSAFAILVGRYQQRVYRLACRLTSETAAADLLQETFLQAFRQVASFRGEARFGTWLYRIATNVCLMHRRTQHRRPTEPLDPFLPRFDAAGRHDATPDALRVVCRAEDLLDRASLASKAREGLARLPDIYRDAFVLRDLESLPSKEVADLLGIDAAAVRQRVHRARLMLRGFLEDAVTAGSSAKARGGAR
jgi:RNA polymerase sigma-70 factor (ECF subfamily)